MKVVKTAPTIYNSCKSVNFYFMPPVLPIRAPSCKFTSIWSHLNDSFVNSLNHSEPGADYSIYCTKDDNKLNNEKCQNKTVQTVLHLFTLTYLYFCLTYIIHINYQ